MSVLLPKKSLCVKTSVSIPRTLLNRARTTARQRHHSLSSYVSALLTKDLEEREAELCQKVSP